MESSARAAISVGDIHYFTGRPCKRGHVDKRTASSAQCMECTRVLKRENYNPERDIPRAVAWNRAHPEMAKARTERWLNKNRERSREQKSRYRAKHPDYHRKYYAERPGYKNSLSAKRHAAKINACPKWITKIQKAEMRLVYEASAKLSSETGIPHHVDHIVPLLGPNVCGLHVPWNLRILEATRNMKKHNSLDEEGLRLAFDKPDQTLRPIFYCRQS